MLTAVLGSESTQLLGGPVDAQSLIRITDATILDEGERRRCLAHERERLCLGPDGQLSAAWQLHVLLSSARTAVVTACFARVFFDRASTRRILDDLCAAYHGSADARSLAAASSDPFRAYATAEAERAGRNSPAPSPRPAGPELPLAAAQPATQFDRCSVRIEADRWAALQKNLQIFAHPATIDAFIGAACGSVLTRWCRQDRFAIQMNVDDRRSQAVPATAIGQFTRLIAVPLGEMKNQSFADRVVAFHRSLDLAASETVAPNPDSLPTVAVSWVPPEPGPVARPLEPDHFVFVGASRPGVEIEFHAEENAEGGLVVRLDYVRDHFPARLIADLAHSLDAWLRLLACSEDAWHDSPTDQAWKSLPPEQQARRREINATQGPICPDRLFSGFLRQCRKDPGAVAIITPQCSLTYGEVFGYACRLAQVIHGYGIGRNELVAIAADKGWEQITAALGITLAGAAYLPVDLDLPESRIRHLITCGEARLVVTQSHRADTLPVPGNVEVLALDRLTPVAPGTPPPPVDVAPDDLAYVIFTSGSTGTPKGVMIDHRGAVNTIVDMNARFGVEASDRVLALSRLSFDLSVYDIFGLLAVGGAIVVPAPDLARDPAHWVDLVRQQRVTIWNTVPALMQLFVDYAEESGEPPGSSLRLVWMSGDWIPLTLPPRITALLPAAKMTSLGGATEASIWSILFPITEVDPAWRSIPYGRPMVNQTFHVLDANLAPCPDDVEGELFIGGMGVARGYWKDEEKTKARFLTHPRTGERLYRTGDLGRFLPDGNIEFLGRADFQVKIRGYRIELGEIEAALASHPTVRTAVVVARGASDADRRLVGYVVPDGGAAVSTDELQSFLQGRLAEYMVPRAIVFLERLPLTPNGKVDTKALPEPGAPASDPDRPPHAEPTNEIEAILLDLWHPILGVQKIGIDDNFFALGGNSLSGTRLIIRIRDAFKLPVPVQCLFEQPTIKLLAGAVEQLLLDDIARKENSTATHPR